MNLTAVSFVRVIPTIIVSIADPPGRNTATCVCTLELVCEARCTVILKTVDNIEQKHTKTIVQHSVMGWGSYFYVYKSIRIENSKKNY